MAMDEFYNANNRTWQMYLNMVKMYNYSVFANAKLIVTAEPEVAPTSLRFSAGLTATVEKGKTLELPVITDPAQANKTITYTSGTEGKATVASKKGNNKVVTGVSAGTSVITATCGNVTSTITVTVTEASA